MKTPDVPRARRTGRAALLATAALSAVLLTVPGTAAGAAPAAAPAAASAPVAVPAGAVAPAAVSAADFRLKPGTDLGGRVDDLLAALPTQGVQNLMAQANRTAT